MGSHVQEETGSEDSCVAFDAGLVDCCCLFFCFILRACIQRRLGVSHIWTSHWINIFLFIHSFCFCYSCSYVLFAMGVKFFDMGLKNYVEENYIKIGTFSNIL